jgi:hypothetical protein
MSKKQWGHGYWRGVKATQTNNSTLVGLWFHTYKDGAVSWQGRVAREIGGGKYGVQLYDWAMGEPSVQKIVHVDTMSDWDFYPTAEAMRWAQHTRSGGSAEDWEYQERVINMLNKRSVAAKTP